MEKSTQKKKSNNSKTKIHSVDTGNPRDLGRRSLIVVFPWCWSAADGCRHTRSLCLLCKWSSPPFLNFHIRLSSGDDVTLINSWVDSSQLRVLVRLVSRDVDKLVHSWVKRVSESDSCFIVSKWTWRVELLGYLVHPPCQLPCAFL